VQEKQLQSKASLYNTEYNVSTSQNIRSCFKEQKMASCQNFLFLEFQIKPAKDLAAEKKRLYLDSNFPSH